MSREHFSVSDQRIARSHSQLSALSFRSQPSVKSLQDAHGNRARRNRNSQLRTAACADDDAIRTLLGSAAGKKFRVGPEHFLAKASSKTALVTGLTA